MSNIRKAFEQGKAFIPFITCGDPDLETTGAVVRAAVENGADLIELGIPFSDPTAEGNVIQAERFLSSCKECEIDGLILPDLPFEEKEEFLPVCHQYGVDLISLIAPTSANRIAMIAKEAEGFLYIVSSLGVTGARSEIKTDLASIVEVVRQNTDIPCAIGFGISTPEQAKKMADISDGAIVGSAIVKLLETYKKEAPEYVGAYVKTMKDSLR